MADIRTWHAPGSAPAVARGPAPGPRPAVQPRPAQPAPGKTGSAPRPKTWTPQPGHWLTHHLGKPVRCRLLDGTELQGDLVAIFQYDLLLRCGGEEVLLLKHAVSTIHAGRPS